MTTFSIPSNCEHFHDASVYLQISAIARRLVPLLDKHGDLMGPWNARVRRKVARGTAHGIKVVRSLRRDLNDWTVREETHFSSTDFTAIFEEWWSWDFDPTRPFPYRSWDDEKLQTVSVWDELTGDWFRLQLEGSVGHFLRFVGVERSVARQIIDACEQDGAIDAQDAMISRLVLV